MLVAVTYLVTCAPGDAVVGGVDAVERLAGQDAGLLHVAAGEGTQRGRAEGAERGGIPGGGGEGLFFEGHDERRDGFGVGRFVACTLEGDGDDFLVARIAAMPGLRWFAVPGLLENDGAVGGELDDDDAVDLGGDASAAGVEGLELACGVREWRGDEEEESCDEDEECVRARAS